MAYNVGTHSHNHNTSILPGMLSNQYHRSTPGLFGNPTSTSSANCGSFQYYLDLFPSQGQVYNFGPNVSTEHLPQTAASVSSNSARTPVVPNIPESPSPCDDVEDEEGNLILALLPNSCDDFSWKVEEMQKKILRYQQHHQTGQISPNEHSRGCGTFSAEPMDVVNPEDLEVQQINESFEEQQRQRKLYESDDLMSLFYSASEDGSPRQKACHLILPPDISDSDRPSYAKKIVKQQKQRSSVASQFTAKSNKAIEFDLGPTEPTSPVDNISALGDSIVNHLLADSPGFTESCPLEMNVVPSTSRERDKEDAPSPSPGSSATVNEPEEEDSWENADDEELSARLDEMKLSVAAKKRREDHECCWDPSVLDHVLEVFDLPSSKSKADIEQALCEIGYGHARLVEISAVLFFVSFGNATEAHHASIVKHDWIRLRPLRYSAKGVQRCALAHEDRLGRSKAPHKNYVGVARRMVEHALGQKANISAAQRKAENDCLRELRAAKKSIAKEFD